jgi:polynucleotide 5'-kinase involved in rRNA processing
LPTELNSPQVEQLTTLLDEAIRSSESSVNRFIEPAPGRLQEAKNRTHSLVFGRRGSGKSSLLRKAAAELTIDRRPIAYVDLEIFKGHSYPSSFHD